MNDQFISLDQRYQSKLDGYYDQQRPEMLTFIPLEVDRVLDIGCSSGGFAELVKQNRPGAVVWGIEPEADAANRASAKIDRVIRGTFEKGMPELDGERFDCIVFNDVLEHLVDPNRVLVDCRDHLNEKGIVVASIPNILHFYQIASILTEQDWKYEDDGILDNTHLRFFTKKSIVRLFEEAGFSIERIEGINPSYGLKFRFANLMTLGRLADWKYTQFGVSALVST